MNPLRWLKERRRQRDVTDVLKTLVDAIEEGTYVPNRAHRRFHTNSLKLKGPGYTRAMRKGRTQRTTDSRTSGREETQ